MKQRVYKESVIKERDLVEFGRCSLRVKPGLIYRESDLIYTAEETLRVVMFRTWAYGGMNLSDIRSFVDDIWKGTIHRKITAELGSQLIRIAKRIKDLVSFYEVLHPVAPYNLGLEKATIEGEYGLIGLKGNKQPELVVQLRDSIPLYPSLIDCARFIHAKKESIRGSIRILNYSVLQEEQKYYDIDLKKAHSFLNQAAESYFSYHTFPSPGIYCETCQTKGCLNNG